MKRFNVINCGRRFGKDILDRDLAIGVLKDHKPVGWFEPTYKSLAENWRNLRALLAPIAQEVSVQEHRLKILGGGVLEMWSLDNPDAGRGRKYAGVIVNEAALGADLEYSWQHTIRPTLFDLAGWALFSSTPRGMNYFYNLYQRSSIDGELGILALSYLRQSVYPPEEIENAKREMPARVFQQEILAEFLADEHFFKMSSIAQLYKNRNGLKIIRATPLLQELTGRYQVISLRSALGAEIAAVSLTGSIQSA